MNVTTGILGSPPANFLDNLQGEKRYSQFGAYQSSKLGNILFTYELARRITATGITVNCFHPGPVSTRFTQKAGGILRVLATILRPIMKSPEVAARTAMYLATAPEVAKVTGGSFVDCRQKRTAPITYDRAVAEKHWRISEKMTSASFPVSRSRILTPAG